MRGIDDSIEGYLAYAERAAAYATRRERLNTAVLRSWVDDDLAHTLRRAISSL